MKDAIISAILKDAERHGLKYDSVRIVDGDEFEKQYQYWRSNLLGPIEVDEKWYCYMQIGADEEGKLITTIEEGSK